MTVPLDIVSDWKFCMGQPVRKRIGSWWEGRVVGFYSTNATPRGYAVQMPGPRNNGPVQIYPEAALESVPYNNGDPA